MKIVFLTGNLEPGKCGVGDCTRKLAAQLLARGHEIKMIALHDVFLESKFDGLQSLDGFNIACLRLPSIMASKTSFENAKEVVQNFNPDWISLQYVPFSYNDKGLPFGLSRNLLKLSKEQTNWHVMFHELWLGMEKEASIKMYLWGLVQRILVGSMLSNLKPAVIHTQTYLHQTELSTLGFKAEYLPLISSIPRSSTHEKAKSLSVDEISFVLFGSIYPGAPIRQFAKEAAGIQQKYNKEVIIRFLGFNRAGVDEWLAICKEEGVSVEVVGQRPEQFVSEMLSESYFGISTTPFLLAEKSSAVIAMREHGLPVLCVARPFNMKHKFEPVEVAGIVEYVQGRLETYLINRELIKGQNFSSDRIAQNYLNSLEEKHEVELLTTS